MSTIRVNDIDLYYEEHGSGEPLLCIHGTGSSCAFWSEAAVELAKRGRTILYDRRGFSRSDRPEPLMMDVHLHADDAAALLDALDATPATVIGRSQGGEIAVDLALRYPERVRALVLLEGGGLALSATLREWLEKVDQHVYAAAATHMDTVAEAMLNAVLGAGAWEQFPEDARAIFTANGPAIVAEHRGGLLDVTPDELAAIRQPTLLVGATGSGPAFEDVTRVMVAAMPSAEVEWVEGGHVIDPAHPAVLAFVDSMLAAR